MDFFGDCSPYTKIFASFSSAETWYICPLPSKKRSWAKYLFWLLLIHVSFGYVFLTKTIKSFTLLIYKVATFHSPLLAAIWFLDTLDMGLFFFFSLSPTYNNSTAKSSQEFFFFSRIFFPQIIIYHPSLKTHLLCTHSWLLFSGHGHIFQNHTRCQYNQRVQLTIHM